MFFLFVSSIHSIESIRWNGAKRQSWIRRRRRRRSHQHHHGCIHRTRVACTSKKIYSPGTSFRIVCTRLICCLGP